MAYVSKEMKNKIAPVIKALCKEYGIKATLAVRHHSTLVLNIQSGPIDFIANSNRIARETALRRGNDFYADTTYSQVNVYWIKDHYDGVAREFLLKAYDALKGPDFFDHSDIQTDYFHRSHYQDINIGRYNKPYVVTEAVAKKPKAVKQPKQKTTVTVRAGKTAGAKFVSVSEVSGYNPQDNVEPDASFSYYPTTEQLLRNIQQ